MQWRALILLLGGIAMIYVVSLLQDTPHPHPAKIYTSDSPRFRAIPDEVILSTIGGFVYQTSIWFEATLSSQKGMKHGIGPMKTGVIGCVRQMRKPLKVFLKHEENMTDTETWTETFEDRLHGPISGISQSALSNIQSSLQFAVLYHVLDGENMNHYVRIYYVIDDDDSGIPVFKYKDLQLPGSTWINTLTLEKDLILFSRDPDIYRCRISSLPADFTHPPHSEEAGLIMIESSHPCDYIKSTQTYCSQKRSLTMDLGWHQPYRTEKHQQTLSRLHSPIPDTYRLLSLDVHKTPYAFHINATIMDNVSIVTQLSELRGEPERVWIEREHWNLLHDTYSDDQSDFVFADIGNIHQERVGSDIPRVSFTKSSDSKSIVIPHVKNNFHSIDYADRAELDERYKSDHDYMYSSDGGKTYLRYARYKIRTGDAYEADILGAQMNAAGNLLAIWTGYQNQYKIYIYKRGVADLSDAPRRRPSVADKMDQWLDVSIPEPTEAEQADENFPPDWKLRMAIVVTERELNSPPAAVQFLNMTSPESKTQNNYVLVALRNGAVNSYLIDDTEEEKEVNFMTFVTERWDMLIAMSMIISVFVFNEYQQYGR
ncbi:hypothetical protein EC973_008575 [Apophysomyces ossiformis]|uniref:Uncharacterized protein n=1 Tax=Apophysomyces ossiformis TaxID=679940 RepID=A0A8H7ETK0_9FUNG|nr:hypothetical protein EC973_008575 [Apophysomyces ossiformis]